MRRRGRDGTGWHLGCAALALMLSLFLAACGSSRATPTDASGDERFTDAGADADSGADALGAGGGAGSGDARTDAGDADTGPAIRPDAADAGPCIGPLDGGYGCAATFEVQRQEERFCFAPLAGLTQCESRFGACGNYQVFYAPFGIGTLICVYDAAGTQLVSVTNGSDVNEFCGGTSFSITHGADIDLSAACNISNLPRTPLPADGGRDQRSGD